MKTAEMAGKVRRPDGHALQRSPVPREQFVEPVDRVLGDTGQHVGQPSLRIDVIHFCRDDDAVHGGSALSAAIGAGESTTFGRGRYRGALFPRHSFDQQMRPSSRKRTNAGQRLSM